MSVEECKEAWGLQSDRKQKLDQVTSKTTWETAVCSDSKLLFPPESCPSDLRLPLLYSWWQSGRSSSYSWWFDPCWLGYNAKVSWYCDVEVKLQLWLLSKQLTACISCQSCQQLVTAVKAVNSFWQMQKLPTACNSCWCNQQLVTAFKPVDSL